MGFLKETSLAQLQFYLKTCHGQVGICCNQAIPQKLLQKSKLDAFYYYQNRLLKQELNAMFVQGSMHDLPFLTDSIDIFLLWHNLDTEEEPKRVIRELHRCLAPNGVVLIIGANNPSLFARNKHQRHFNKRNYLAQLFLHHGFEIEVQKTLGFRPALKNAMLFQALKPLEVIGQFCWPMLGINYFIQARKSVLGTTPLVAETKRIRFKQPKAIAEPSTFKYQL